MVALALAHLELQTLRRLMWRRLEAEPWLAQVTGYIAQLLILKNTKRLAAKAIWSDIRQALVILRSARLWIPSQELTTMLYFADDAIDRIPDGPIPPLFCKLFINYHKIAHT